MLNVIFYFKKSIRYLISIIYNIIFFKSKSSGLYIGSRVCLVGKIKLGKNVHIYDNVKIYGDITILHNCSISENVEIRTNYSSIVIGENCTLNRNSIIIGKVRIGNYVMIAPNVTIVGSNHVFSDKNKKIRYQGIKSNGIFIGDDVWVGANSVILDGVKIGEGSIIGAGSVVTKDIPPFKIAVGNPCKIIKDR